MAHVTQINDSVYTVRDFFTPDECDSYIRMTEEIGYVDAPITTSRGPLYRPEIRNNTRVMLDDVDRTNLIWERAAPFVQNWDTNWQPIGLNERLRFYRYDIGQQFNWHNDGFYARPNGERSWLTFMIYLNAGFEGGQTVFKDAIVTPETGMALFFVHRIQHKGSEVTAGRKYVLRSDVMFRLQDS